MESPPLPHRAKILRGQKGLATTMFRTRQQISSSNLLQSESDWSESNLRFVCWPEEKNKPQVLQTPNFGPNFMSHPVLVRVGLKVGLTFVEIKNTAHYFKCKK